MMQDKFSYSTQPHVAPLKSSANRPKYRDDEESNANRAYDMRNLMYDSRIIRGSTYGKQKSVLPDKENEPKWKKTSLNKTDPSKRKFISKRGSTPPPVEGRNHIDMQTDDFLEELTDRPIQIDIETQTLPFADRPPSPLFVRSKIGHDIETQIYPGDLFDFDLEVEPILEVLVGKTLHVAMLEVLQEEELEAIRIQQEEYETIRNVEIAELQRLEADLRRKADEKKRRIEQEKKRVEERKLLEEKIAARSFSQQYLSQLHINIFNMLEAEGVFYDPLKKEVEEIFLQDIVVSVTKQYQGYELAVMMMDELLNNARTKAIEYENNAIILRKEYYDEIARQEAIERETQRLKAEEEARLLAEQAKLEEAEEVDQF